jgi:hypothetical protein
MLQSIRIVIVLLLGGLCTVVQANGTFRYCPASPVAAVSGDSTSPFELIWDVSGGTESRKASGKTAGFPLSAVLAPDNVLELLFAGSFAADSTCVLEGTLVFADENSEPLDDHPVSLAGGDGMTFTLYQPKEEAGRQIVRYRLKDGKATGCTRKELKSIAVTATVLKRRPDVEEFCSGLACAEPLDNAPYRVWYSVDNPYSPSHPLDLQCPASPVAAVSTNDNVSPFDLIWDVDGGTTTQAVKESTELVILVTPVITPARATPWGTVLGCKETFEIGRYDVNFLPKVKVEVVVEDDKGNSSTKMLELDAETQSAVLNYPYIDGGISRHLQRVKVKAKGSSCYDLQATLYTVDDESGDTLTKQSLGGVIRKAVPPPAFTDGTDG